MGMMKRARIDEVQYSQRPTGTSGGGSSHHRLLNSGQHNSIQYQLAQASSAGVLKSGNIGDTSPVGSVGLSSSVQYTATYTSSVPASSVTKGVSQGTGAGTGIGGTSPTATGPLHVTNTGISPVNSMRHKNTSSGGNPTMNPQVGAAGPQPGGPHPPRLKVEDALSYLDQVKYQYSDQPQIYNNFLDIMKEFKSQCIDTPGVIQRVSSLFKGHPDLIYGFNMFLPPGYKIEIQSNDQGISIPVVSMPSPPGSGASCLQQSSPAHKTGSIVHQIPSNAVNLMTHPNTAAVAASSGNLPQSLHGNLPPPQQSTSQVATSAAVPQNYSRDRERSISQSANISVGPSSQGSSSDLNSQGHNLHHISQAHQSILQGEAGGQQNQPVEFNHAITYVNKIKNRFQNTPEKYKKFLEILHTYQKEQKVVKEGSGTIIQSKTLTEAEVYAQVAKLFDQQEDLLREFGQFLPDATNHSTAQYMTKAHNDHKKLSTAASVCSTSHTGQSGVKSYNNSQNSLVRLERDHYDKEYLVPREKDRNHVNQKFTHNASQAKKSPSYSSVPVSHIPRRSDDRDGGPSVKRHKPICRDVTLSEASRYGTLSDAAFFDKLRKALRLTEVYENFLRCLVLYNQELVSKSELLGLATPFLSKFPELYRWFQDFLGPNAPEGISLTTAQRQERNQASELAQEIDLTSCKRLGASYCALPKASEPKKCSGRTSLCREVLNENWVSFPTWASEDSNFVNSRKSQFEEILYRCEDERFELDVVIETNSSTIQVLEGVQKKMSRMSPEEVQRFRLDDCLGGNSPTIHQRAVKRIYGDKANDIIQGLKKNPAACVPVVLKRLRSKEEEWREAQKNFNKQWREQYEKYYLKSLDHQSINFKPNDIKALRSKNLFNEIETLYDERNYQNEETDPASAPHLILPYKDKSILDDAANLLIHHVKRQTGIQKQEKTKIKHIVRQFVPDLFFFPRQPLSDDEKEDAFPSLVDEKDMEIEQKPSIPEPVKTKSGNSSSTITTGGGSQQNAMPSTSSSGSFGLVTEKEDNKEGIISTTSTPIAGTSTANIPSGNGRGNSSKSGNSGNPSNNGSPTTSGMASTSSSATTGGCSSNVTNSHCNNSKLLSNLNAIASKLSGSGSANASSINDSKVLGSETAPVTSKAHNTDGSSAPSIEIKEEKTDCVPKSPPLPQHAISKQAEEAYILFFANNNWYLFLRLHAILCERLRVMYDRGQILYIEEQKNGSNRRENTAKALRLKQKSDVKVEDYYPTFLDMLKNVLDGNMDSNNYEDSLREMFGIHAYIAFTLDRVVSSAVRQLQHCVTERGALECVEMFQTEQRKGGAGGLCRTANKRIAAEMAYQKKAETRLREENCFKVYIYKLDCRLTIELLDTEGNEDTEKNVSTAKSWNKYVESMANPIATTIPNSAGTTSTANKSATSSDLSKKTNNKVEKHAFEVNVTSCPRKPLYLKRDIRRFNKYNSTTSTAQTITQSQDISETASTLITAEELKSKVSAESTTTTTTVVIEGTSGTAVPSTSSDSPGTTGNSDPCCSDTTAVQSTLLESPEKSTTSESPEKSNTSGGAYSPKEGSPIENPFWKKRPPERMGQGIGVNENYIICDDEEVKINPQSYKMVFVVNKNAMLYKKGSIQKARESHAVVTRSKEAKFQNFIGKWLEKHVSEAQRQQCNDWLMGKSSDLAPNVTIINQDNDLKKTPYKRYNRYKLERIKLERTSS